MRAYIPEKFTRPYYEYCDKKNMSASDIAKNVTDYRPFPSDKDVYGQEFNKTRSQPYGQMPDEGMPGKLNVVKNQQDFLDLPIGAYIVDCQFWYIDVNGAVPVTISRKIRQPSEKELSEPCPINDTHFLVARFTPQKIKLNP